MAPRRSKTPAASRAGKLGVRSSHSRLVEQSCTPRVSNKLRSTSSPKHLKRLKSSGIDWQRLHRSSNLAKHRGLLGVCRTGMPRIPTSGPLISAKQALIADALSGKGAKASPPFRLSSKYLSSNSKTNSPPPTKMPSGLEAASTFEGLGDSIIENTRASDTSGQTPNNFPEVRHGPWQSLSPATRAAWASAIEGFGSEDLPLRAGGLSAWSNSAADENDDSSHTLGRSQISDSEDDSSEEEETSSGEDEQGPLLNERRDNAVVEDSSSNEDNVEEYREYMKRLRQALADFEGERSASKSEDSDVDDSVLGGFTAPDDDLSDTDE